VVAELRAEESAEPRGVALRGLVRLTRERKKSKMMKRTLFAILTLVALVLTNIVTPAQAQGALSATPTTIAGATLDGLPATASSPPGVSPEVFFDEATGTYYLWTTDNPAKMYTSKDGTSWSAVAGATLPDGFDWSIVKLGPANYRMYFAAINPNAASEVECSKQRKELRYATSTNLTNWVTQPGALVTSIGCGVPHVLRKPDGTYLLYYNSMEPQHGMYIATSPDGLTWTKRPGIIANDPNLVDPAPLQMPDGTYLMIASTTGAPLPGSTTQTSQQLRILSSTDAISWSLRNQPLLAPQGVSVLDPALKLIGQQLRVWYGYAPGGNHANSRITSGVLTLKAGTVDTATPTATKTKSCKKVGEQRQHKGAMYTCKKVKGKLIWVKS